MKTTSVIGDRPRNGVVSMSKRCFSMKSAIGLLTVVSSAMVATCSSSSLGSKPVADAGATTQTGGAPGGNAGATSAAGGAGGTSFGGTATGGATSALCNPPVTLLCTGTRPPSALISDFSLANGATVPPAFGPWGQSVSGGTYVFPGAGSDCAPAAAYPISQSFTGGVWNVTGTVGTYSGMGTWWVCDPGTGKYASSCLIDASAYTGISFKVSGDVGPKGAMTLNVGTPSTVKADLDADGKPKNCATCTGDACRGVAASVPVTSTPTTVSLSWAELGVSEPNAIEQILFMLPDPCDYSTGTCVATPYPVNVSIDDMMFTN
jgi:hypothetical protein